MAKRISSLSVQLTGDTANFSKSMKGASGDVKDFSNEVSKTQGKSKGFFDDLNKSLGSRRLGAKLVGGGIAGFIGSEVQQLTQKAAEAADEFRKGQLDATGMVVKLAEGVPLLGSWVTAGQSIREIITGEAVEIEKVNQSTKVQNEFLSYQRGLIEANYKTWVETEKTLQSIADAQERIGKEGFQLADTTRTQEAAGRQRALEEKRVADQKANADKQRDELDKLSDQRRQGSGDLKSDLGLGLRKTLTGALGPLGLLLPTPKPAPELDFSSSLTIKAGKQRAGTIDKAAAETEKAEHERSNLEFAAADAKASLDGVRLVQQRAHEVADIRAETNAAQLKGLGETLAAESVIIDAETAKKKEAVQKQLEEDEKKSPERFRSQLAKQAQDTIDALDKEAAAKKAANQNEQQLSQDLREIQGHHSRDAVADTNKELAAYRKLFDAGKISVQKFNELSSEAKEKLDHHLEERANSIIEETKTPVEKYSEKLTELHQLLSAGKITQQQFSLAANKDLSDLAGRNEAHASSIAESQQAQFKGQTNDKTQQYLRSHYLELIKQTRYQYLIWKSLDKTAADSDQTVSLGP